MRKNFFYFALSLLIPCSCSRTQITESGGNLDDVAIEIKSDYALLTYERLLNEQTDTDFLYEEVTTAMQCKSIYQYRRVATKTGIEELDTLRTSEEIPFYAEVNEQTNIYLDGSSEYIREMNLDPDLNPLLSVYETPMNLENCVSRIEIKDGKSVTYAPDGKILSEQDVEMPDYTDYIQMLTQAQKESEQDTKSNIRHDINWLRGRMEASYPTKSGEQNYRIWSEGDGTVILEQTIAETKAGQPVTMRTRLSSDISKNLGYDQLIDGKLMVRCRNVYTNNPQTKSIGTPLADISDENPSQTITESLCFTQDGTPKIKVEDKTFSVNKIVFHLK